MVTGRPGLVKEEKTGIPVEAVREQRARRREGPARGRAGGAGQTPVSRRQFLLAGAAATAGGLLSWKLGHAAAGGKQPRIAIIGGGLAGLTAALTLQDHGYAATIYEALESVGGRTRSDGPATSPAYTASMPACGSCHAVSRPVEPMWEDGQVTDVFGELIDSDHATMLALAQRFGLQLTDLLASEPPGATETYYFFDRYYPKADADRDFAALYPTLQSDLHAAGYPTTWNRSKPGGRRLDAMSLSDWIEWRVPAGHSSPFGALLDVAYNIEYGAETADQSALNLVYLAIPFAALRTLDYEDAGFDALKVQAIRELGAGHNGKLHLQFVSRLWNQPGAWGVSRGTSYPDSEAEASRLLWALRALRALR